MLTNSALLEGELEEEGSRGPACPIPTPRSGYRLELIPGHNYQSAERALKLDSIAKKSHFLGAYWEGFCATTRPL